MKIRVFPTLNVEKKVKIIFEDKNFIIVEKPAGLAVYPGIGNKGKTLVDFLLKKFPEIKSVGDMPEIRPGIVHRLDKETSGVMIVTRNQKAFEYFKNLFKDRKVEKKYLALVHGRLKNKEGKIEGEMGRSRRDFRKQSLVRGKISVRKERYSLTHYKVLKYKEKIQTGKKSAQKNPYGKICAQDVSDGYSLLEVFPKTGRMHQIRVHLHSIGHPIVGDEKYTFKKYKHRKYPRMFLHANQITFIDQKGKTMKFASSLPKEMKEYLSRVDCEEK